MRISRISSASTLALVLTVGALGCGDLAADDPADDLEVPPKLEVCGDRIDNDLDGAIDEDCDEPALPNATEGSKAAGEE